MVSLHQRDRTGVAPPGPKGERNRSAFTRNTRKPYVTRTPHRVSPPYVYGLFSGRVVFGNACARSTANRNPHAVKSGRRTFVFRSRHEMITPLVTISDEPMIDSRSSDLTERHRAGTVARDITVRRFVMERTRERYESVRVEKSAPRARDKSRGGYSDSQSV